MKETNTTSYPAPASGDPRFTFAQVAGALGSLIDTTDDSMLANQTPCPEFQVKELLEHCVFVARRVAAIGRGEHWSTVCEEKAEQGWAQDYRAALHDIMDAWADPAVLEKVIEVPWGAFPGVALMYTYSAELAVHGWDLAQATGLTFEMDDDQLHGALEAIKFIPAEGRDDPDMPFSAVVDPGPGASVLDQLAGWAGRPVNG